MRTAFLRFAPKGTFRRTARKGADGSYTVQFGDCDGKVPNCLPIMPGWNYTVRIYRPRGEIVNGKWNFPVARPVR
jgi:hypothetical protein